MIIIDFFKRKRDNTMPDPKSMSSPKPLDLRKVLSKHKNKWVALKPNTNTVVSSGKELSEVLEESKKKGVEKPVILQARPVQNLFAG